MDVIRRSVNWLQVGFGVGLGMLVLGKVATAQETMLYVDQVVPSQVSVGQVFTIQGEFPGMTSAAAFLSDGMFGLPLTVLEVTERQILARIDAIPWPMTGTLHVLNQEGVRAISNQTWQGDGVTLDVIGGIQFESTQAASGAVLTVMGAAPMDPPQVFGVFGNGLSLLPTGPCKDSTVLVLIEVELGALNIDGDPCKGFGARVHIRCENGVTMPVANYYNTLAEGLHQLFSPNDVHVRFDPNSNLAGNGALFIEQVVDCPTYASAAALIGE